MPRLTKRPGLKSKENLKAPEKLLLLVTIVERSKTDFYGDLISTFEANLQWIVYGWGTAPKEYDPLGLGSQGKAIIFSVIKAGNAKKLLSIIDQKFHTIRNGKGIAYTIPLKSVIGVSIYQFLSNDAKDKKVGD